MKEGSLRDTPFDVTVPPFGSDERGVYHGHLRWQVDLPVLH